jgi:hypothetical protein
MLVDGSVKSLSGHPSWPSRADVTLTANLGVRYVDPTIASGLGPVDMSILRIPLPGTLSRLRPKSCRRLRPLPDLLVTSSIKLMPCMAGTLECTTSNKDENGVVWRRAFAQICFLGSCRYVALTRRPYVRAHSSAVEGDLGPTYVPPVDSVSPASYILGALRHLSIQDLRLLYHTPPGSSE